MTSIRRALIGRLVPALLLMLAIIGGGLYLLVREQLTADFDSALADKGRVLAGLMKHEATGVELDLDETPMPEFSRAAEPEYLQVWLGDTVFLRSPSLSGDLPRPARKMFGDLRLPDGRPGRAVWVQFGVRSEGPPPVPALPRATLVVARGRAPLDRALHEVAVALGLGGMLLSLIVPLVVAAGVQRGLRPLDDVAEQAARIDARTLQGRFGGADLPAELRPIAARLDDLLDRLAAAFERERRFSADVAHELRTPIAELRALAEVALAAPEAADRRAFEDVLGAALQMENLVTTLLALARCEAGRQPVTIESLALDRALDEAWAPLAAQARTKGLRLRRGDCAVTVGADRLMLASILGNLLANAVEYAPAGGFVAWTMEDGALVISNSNDNLAAADLAHVFEPFWRKDAARTDGAHGGLGLSLVAAYARLVGGEVQLALGAASEVRARVQLRPAPVAPGPPPPAAA